MPIWDLPLDGITEPQYIAAIPTDMPRMALTPNDELLVGSVRDRGQVVLQQLLTSRIEVLPLYYREADAVSFVDIAANSGSILVVSTRKSGTPTPTHVGLVSAEGRMREFNLDIAIYGCAVSPDGGTIAVVAAGGSYEGSVRQRIELLDVASGLRTVLTDDVDVDDISPAFSRDGRIIFWIRRTHSSDGQIRTSVREHRLGNPDGESRAIAGDRGWDVREIAPGAWGELYVVAVEKSGADVYRIDPNGVSRITHGGDHRSLVVSADLGQSTWLYALRATDGGLEVPIRLAPRTPDQHPEPLLSPRLGRLRL